MIYNYFYMYLQVSGVVENQENLKARCSNSTNHSQNDERDSNSTLRFSDVIPQPVRFYRLDYFVDASKQTVSKKLNRSAVSWIQAQCWTKNVDLQPNFLAVTLYYCYAHNKQFQKSQLQAILIACLYIANKFYSGPIDTIEKALSLVSKQYEPTTIIKIQSEILQLVGFDLFFSNIYHLIESTEQEYSKSEYHRLCFFIELLLLKDHSVLFSEEKLDQLNLLLFNENQNTSIKSEISQVLKSPQAETLVNKYRAIIQVDQVLSKLR